MRFLLRTLLIWLLALALPAQGVAAATRVFCGPNHHGGGAAMQLPAAAASAHAHHSHAAVSADNGSLASAAVEQTSDTSDVSKQKCSACAACCSTGALLSPQLTVPVPVFAPTVFAMVVQEVPTFAADGPDRPPRIVLA